MKTLLATALVSVAAAALAQTAPGVWRSPDGVALPDTNARRAKQGFGVWLLVTPDQDWEAKWNTPSTVTPYFTETAEVRRGGTVTVLLFVVNPGVDANGNADVQCDLKVVRPDGSLSMNAQKARCLSGKVLGNPSSVRLSEPVIGFRADPGDLAGDWLIQVNMHDAVRGISIPVETAFRLVEK